MEIEMNILEYINGKNGLGGIRPNERYASFDYCFNYFQSFRDADRLREMATSEYMQTSCLQLGFYLASWGMLRGSAALLQKSVKALEPVVQVISSASPALWLIDADSYTMPNIRILLDLKAAITRSLHAAGGASDILVSKIMLGVFGNVPAFDTNFKAGFDVSTFGHLALVKIGRFYDQYSAVIDRYRLPTLDFSSGMPTQRHYTRAKVIDMIFFIEGSRKTTAPMLTL